MCTLDERILELVEKEPLASPRYIASTVRLHASVGRVRERCQMLSDAGFIAPISDDYDMFEVTTEGRLYLSGDLDAETRPRPRARG